MSTLFETFYDSFCHEIHIGQLVFFKTKGIILLGNIKEMKRDKNGDEKYVIVPKQSYKPEGIESFKKTYTVSWKNTFMAAKKQSN